MTTIYGIKNCDTMKKAINWLKANQIDYRFHDYRKEGLTESLLKDWIEQLGYEALINKRSTTWRKLSELQKNTLNKQTASSLILQNEAIIKRPLLIYKGTMNLGFKPESYQLIFNI